MFNARQTSTLINCNLTMLFLTYCWLYISVCGAFAAVPKCRDNEMLCYDKQLCVKKSEWCNGYSDCDDNSDERHCNGASNFSNHDLPPILEANLLDEVDVKVQALEKAARYILNQRNSYGNWGRFTPRAVIALAFAGRASLISEQEKQLLPKTLNLELLFNLMQNRTAMSDSSLALYINALHATCQDPRKFEGMDLVARLRETIRKSNLPLPMLTLCLADDTMDRNTMFEDGDKLVQMFNEGNVQSWQGSTALTAMAMICYSRRDGRDYTPYLNSIFRKNNSTLKMDTYNKALFMQVRVARGDYIVPEDLTSNQTSDGSFGDLLSTYLSIPVLLNSSLLDLKCNSYTNTGKRFGSLMMDENTTHRIILSIWIGVTKDVRSHSLTLSFDGFKYLQDVMIMAAERDPLYSFSFVETTQGNILYKLANVPNDIESRKSWKIYSGKIGNITLGSAQNLRDVALGIDRVTAADGQHFVFWMKRN